jgi:D-xylose transport system permease protein
VPALLALVRRRDYDDGRTQNQSRPAIQGAPIVINSKPPVNRTDAPAAQAVSLANSSLHTYAPIVALTVVWVVFAWLTRGIFLTPRNFSNLIRQTAVTGLPAVGMMMVMLAGQIDLSVGSIVGLSGMTAVVAQVAWHAGLVASLLAGILVGLAIGILQGSLTAYARIPSFIVTLGGLLVWRGLAKNIGGGNTLPVEVRAFKTIGQSYLSPFAGFVLILLGVALSAWIAIRRNKARVVQGAVAWSPLAFLLRVLGPAVVITGLVFALNEYAGVPVPVLIFAVIALIAAWALSNTAFGRSLYAPRSGREACGSSVDKHRPIVWTFAILGALAGLTGIISAARLGSAGAEMGSLLEVDAIAACLIGGASLSGGRGTILGACLGALIMASLDNGMSLRNVPESTQYIVKGIVLVSAAGVSMIGHRD